MSSTIFLLSPAMLGGIRARQLTSPRAQFPAAMRYRSEEGVPIAEAFAFMSALYFRGKIGYARHFAAPPDTLPAAGVYVIAPGFGLVSPEWPLTQERLKAMKKVPVDETKRSYRKPLQREAEALAAQLEEDTQVVLLGSIATGKYVDVLRPIFGASLRFPAAFAGLGDMSRGGLMLRAVRENRELAYTTLDAPRHRQPGGSGKMPAL
ncbi:MAG: hypothetical protein ABI837_17555 [Acidobacteriota bacterium]